MGPPYGHVILVSGYLVHITWMPNIKDARYKPVPPNLLEKSLGNKIVTFHIDYMKGHMAIISLHLHGRITDDYQIF